MEQKVQPPKQPRMMLTLKRIISHAGILVAPSWLPLLVGVTGVRRCGRTAEPNTRSISAVVSGIGGGLIHTSRAVCAFAMRLYQGAGVAGVGFQVQHAAGMGVQARGQILTCS
jgi:hypothetical protein